MTTCGSWASPRRGSGSAGSTRTPASTGLFGVEDEEQIRPACDDAAAAGIDADGPLPADSAFRQAYAGVGHEEDVLTAAGTAWRTRYHDQGHVPMKLIAFEDGVNVTVGLPIIRTSVEHGTAFDIAGQGVANPANMQAAIEYARRLAAGEAG